MYYPRLKSKAVLIRLLFLALIVPVLFSCSSGSRRNNEKAIARAYGNYLYKSDIQGLLPQGTNPDDSLRLVKSYIELW